MRFLTYSMLSKKATQEKYVRPTLVMDNDKVPHYTSV